jgi:hypothetical protein
MTNQGPDRMAIAEQVIVSAGNVLRAAGFDRGEIASFFHQAAAQLADGTSRQEPETARATRLHAEFAAIPPVRELARLQRERAADALPTSEEALEAQFTLAMEIIPHLGAAQEWLRGMADEAGLVLQTSRAEGPADVRGALFLEDFEAVYGSSFELIASLLETLVAQGHEAAFRPLLLSLVNHNVTVTSELKRSMEKWAGALG